MSEHPTTVIHGQPSWHVASSTTEAWLTEVGGHLAPVTFRLGEKRVSPFSIAPWNEEGEDPAVAGLVPILRVLRGDFFCMPFGANAEQYRGEKYDLHGETANREWQLETYSQHEGMSTLHCSLGTQARKGRVDKFIMLRDGETMVYQKHVISGMNGPMTVGHHAMLKFSAEGEGLISTSKAKFRQVWLEPTERPEEKGYSALKPGAVFKELEKVPTVFGGKADVTRYPARLGFEDLVLNVNDPRAALGWAAAVYPKHRFVWFSLKDPRTLASTLLWLSNRGRYYAPWSGRHEGVLGIEDITGFFHMGLARSAKPNELSKRGITTTLTLNAKKPTVVNYIFGVAAIPAGFDHVKEIRPVEGGVELQSRSGKKAKAAVDVTFLQSGV